MFSLLTTLARTRYYYDSSDYGYNYNYSTTGDEGSAIAVLIVLLIFLFALIAGYVVTSLFFAGIFKKAGISTTAAWIPFYNNWKFFELGGQQGFLSLLAFVPFVGAIITGIFAIINNWKFFELGGQQGFLSLLAFVPFVGAIITGIFAIIAAYNIGLKLGKTGPFVLFYILLAPVWFLILIFSDASWNDSLGEPSLAKGTIIGYATESEIYSAQKADDSTEESTDAEQ